MSKVNLTADEATNEALFENAEMNAEFGELIESRVARYETRTSTGMH